MSKALVLAAALAACSNSSRTQVSQPTTPTATPPIAATPALATPAAQTKTPASLPIAEAKAKLLAAHPEQKERIERGVDQVARLWRASDGDLVAFCSEQFVVDPDPLFARLEAMVEQVRGHFNEVSRAAKWGSEVETGPVQPVDGLLASLDPQAHLVDDLFTTKVGFAILLNFPLTTLAERTHDGEGYTRRKWAEARLTDLVSARVPGELEQVAIAAETDGDQYIAHYNIWMHHVLSQNGKRLFPSGKRLISHWNLRDELKANYADADGLAKQRTIAKIMDRIVTQTIPPAVIDNPRLDWNPFTNTTAPAQEIEADAPAPHAVTADTRFEHVLAHFHAARAIDPFEPVTPTYIDRAFEAAELPEDRVRKMLVEVLESPLGDGVAKEIQKKLGRPLEPHDLWFPLSRPSTAESELDAVTRKKYPTAAAFAKDIPRILRDLGFSPARATYLAEHIDVDPSRGAGHAMEAMRRGDKAHLRTRVEAHGMDYKGYNIAVHELGHNIEQTFSLYDVDHTLLQGVPNIAFTEALAFLFQARDRELLGRPQPHGEADRLLVLDTFWQTREIAGSALVEIDVWHWLYAHPDATAAQLRDATDAAARDVWDRYFAPELGGKGTELLGIYSHTIASPLYLFNYVLGHLIAFQVEQHLDGRDPRPAVSAAEGQRGSIDGRDPRPAGSAAEGQRGSIDGRDPRPAVSAAEGQRGSIDGRDRATFGKEFERVARLGRISPDLWMTQATGKPVGTASLLEATQKALKP